MIQELETNSINKVSKEFNVNKSTLNSWKNNLEKNKLNIKKGLKKYKVKDLEYYKVRYEILKKLQDLHKQNKKIEFIKANNFPLNIIFKIVNLKQSYWDKYKNYDFKINKDDEILKLIVEVFNNNRKEIGYGIITEKLKSEHKININHKKSVTNYERKQYWSRICKKDD